MSREQRANNKEEKLMIIRTKGMEYRAETSSLLLEFLGVKKDVAGCQKISADVDPNSRCKCNEDLIRCFEA